MKKTTRSPNGKLTLRRETLQRLNDRDLARAAGGVFTDDCLTFPSHNDCSFPCTFSCGTAV